jgi:RimJ/RimL family protein N-acetyltransferase
VTPSPRPGEEPGPRPSRGQSLPAALWPLAGLRVTCDAIELRVPSDADLAALASVAPDDLDLDPSLPATPTVAGGVLRHVWRARAELSPQDWRLCFVVLVDGRVAGEQDLDARQFARRRIVETSSWLAPAYRGRGIARAMRAMVLHLAFTGIDAVAAESETVEGADAALGVSRSLGYGPCGDTYVVTADDRVEHRLWSRLTRQRWELARQGYGLGEIQVDGLAECLSMLGIGPAGGAATH